MFTRVETSHDDDADVVGGGHDEIIHDQRLWLTDIRLTSELGVAHDWAVGLMLPFRLVMTRINFLDGHSHGEVELEAPNIHHRNETLKGFGDPWLWGRFNRAFGDWTAGARVGLTLPLGATREDPFVLGDAGEQHQHIQFGTGTVTALFGLEGSRRFDGWTALSWFTTQQSLYENGKGYQAGDRYSLALAGLTGFGLDDWKFLASLEAQAETAEEWQGLVNREEGNQGRVDLLTGLNASWRFLENMHVGVGVRVPLYVHVKNAQLDFPLVGLVTLGGTYDFMPHSHEAGADDDDHGHSEAVDGHDERNRWEGLDMKELTNTGEAVALTPAPGKITVFDFWADWCAPCHELDALLAAIGRLHPDRLAVRKLNVVDDQSPAWRAYLAAGEHILPHIKVFDAEGKLLWEASGQANALAERVGALLED